MKVYKKYLGKKYTFKHLSPKEDSIYKNLNDYIHVIESLGKLFDIDDTKIYTNKTFNNALKSSIDACSYTQNKKLKDLTTFFLFCARILSYTLRRFYVPSCDCS